MHSLFRRLTRTKPQARDAAADDAHGLGRNLGFFSLTLMGVGATIGTGIFFTLSEAVPKAGPSVILSFVIAAITAGLTALCYAELANRIPASGSSYSFAYASVGEFLAYVMAACLLLEYGLCAGATAIGWSDYLNNFLVNALGWHIPEHLRSFALASGPHGVEVHWGRVNLPPMLLVGLCCVLLVRGAKESVFVNSALVLIKLAILVLFVVLAAQSFDVHNFQPFLNTDTSKGLAGFAGVTAAAGTVFFSFIGLDTVATAGEEVKDPCRTVPRAIIAALVIVTAFYLMVVVAALGAQPAAKFQGQEAGLAVILQQATGKVWPALLLSAGAVISVFSVTLLCLYGQTRILYAVSLDGLLPKVFSRVNPRTQTPIRNTLLVCAAVSLVAGFVDAALLWDMVSMGTLTAFMVVSLSVPVVRRRATRAPAGQGFEVPGGPYLVPGLSALSCLFVMKDLSATTFTAFGVWMSFAVLVYFGYGLRNSRLNALAA